MAMEEIVKQLSEALGKEGNSRVVFGEPVKLDNKTVIPVAAVRIAGGAARVSPPEKQSALVKALFGGGGGGAFDVRPVGFISERAGEVAFTAIHLDGHGQPFLTEAASGLGKLFDSASALAGELFKRRLFEGHKPKGAAR